MWYSCIIVVYHCWRALQMLCKNLWNKPFYCKTTFHTFTCQWKVAATFIPHRHRYPSHVVLVRAACGFNIRYRIINWSSEHGHLLNLLATPATLCQEWHTAPAYGTLHACTVGVYTGCPRVVTYRMHESASSDDLDAVPKRDVAFNVGRSRLRLWVVPGCIFVSLPVHLY